MTPLVRGLLICYLDYSPFLGARCLVFGLLQAGEMFKAANTLWFVVHALFSSHIQATWEMDMCENDLGQRK